MKKIVYTAIIGDYDTLKEPLVVTPGWEYKCFTDQPLTSKAWEIIYVPTEEDKVRQARKIKIIPPFDYDLCLWMDATFLIKGNLDLFVSHIQQSTKSEWLADMYLPKHPHRDRVIDEAQKVIDLGKDSVDIVNRQMAVYMKSTTYRDFINTTTLPATGILLRKNTYNVRRFSRVWNDEINNFSRRDQLSFGFAALLSGVSHLTFNDNIYDKSNPFFQLYKHK